MRFFKLNLKVICSQIGDVILHFGMSVIQVKNSVLMPNTLWLIQEYAHIWKRFDQGFYTKERCGAHFDID